MKKFLFTLCLCAGALNLFASKDTINLSDPMYAIDDIEAYYYTSGGQTYYSVSIWNYDSELPEFRIEVKATDKTHIQGLHETDLEFCFLDLDESTHLTVSKVVFWLKYTGKNIDGDSEYDIIAMADASDGKVYLYRGNMPVYAYDRDNGDAIIPLQDALDAEIVEPDIEDHGPATGINDVQGDEVQCTKVLRDGQIFIKRNGKLYNMNGIEL